MSKLQELLNQTSIISKDVLIEKYCKNGETTVDEVYARVAKGLASVEKEEEREEWEKAFLAHMYSGGIGAGRIMSAAGTGINATLANCFVLGISDSLLTDEGSCTPGIYNTLSEAAKTLSKGGGVGYNFSAIRPKKSYVRGTHSHSSGPCSYMDAYNASAKTIESAGQRRGAQMGVLDVDHPDIQEFIVAKQTPGRWDYFNVSVGVSEAFMQAVESDSAWELVHKEPPHPDYKEGVYQRDDSKYVYEVIQARDLFNKIMKSTYDFAEPGILFLDTINRENNLHYCELLKATNPCGELPTSEYGCCDLGPIILTNFIKNAFSPNASFEFERFKEAVAVQVRLLDNVLDATAWPLPQQKKDAADKRRIGVGYTGIGDTLAMLNMRYGSKDALDFIESIALTMRDTAYRASVELAKVRGPFGLFDVEKHLEGEFIKRLPEDIRDGIREYGIRNSHLLSIAPTGTVSLAFADNASNGIEPAFSWVYDRRKRESDGSWKPYKVMDHAFKRYISEVMPTKYTEETISKFVEAVSEGRAEFIPDESVTYTHRVKELLPESFVTALELNVDEHLSALLVTQPYIDSAISKTCNVPEDYPFEDFCDIYMKAWKGGLKGISTYRPNPIRPGILTAPTEKKEEVKKDVVTPIVQEDIDLRDVVIGSLGEGDLPAIKTKKIMTVNFEDQNIHIAVSFLNMKGTYHGREVEIMRPVEFFVPQSQIDESPQWVTSTMRTLSLLARQGMAFARALADNRNIRWDKGNVRCGTLTKSDGSVVPRFHASDVAAISWVIQDLLIRAGYLDESGRVKSMAQLIKVIGASDAPKVESAVQETKAVVTDRKIIPGKTCQECGADAVIKVDGCQKCTSCGWQGSCNG